MRLLVTVLALGTGCTSIFGLEAPLARKSDGGVDDAPTQPEDVARDACISFSTVVNTCVVDFGPEVDLTGFAVTFDTDAKTVSGISGQVPTFEVPGSSGPITFIVVQKASLSLLGSVRVVGSRAGGVLSNTTISVGGTIDVGNGGAAARTACGSTAGAARTTGAAGGGGGGFWGAGGSGSPGDNGVAIGGTGGPSQARPASPIGGCAGSPGGAGTTLGGAGGLGGGALILVARTSITVSGTIDANGQGGRGGPNDNGGGGGGGAGGMIMLEAPAIQISGVLAANGGGGGEGAGGNPGDNGVDGQNSSQRAAGGAGGATAGANGGLGGAGTTLDGSTPNGENGGGGGGGGGVGFIVVKGPAPVIMPGGVVSPTVTVVP